VWFWAFDTEAARLTRIEADLDPASEVAFADVPVDAEIAVEVSADGTTRVYSLPDATAIVGQHSILRHPIPMSPPPGAQIGLDVTFTTPFATGDQMMLTGVGAWITHVFPLQPAATDTTWTVQPFPYAMVDTFGDAPLEAIRNADDVFLLRYDTTGLVGVGELTDSDMVAGVNHFDVTVDTVVMDRQVQIAGISNELQERIAALVPAYLDDFTARWQINAAPGASRAAAEGVRLNHGSLPTTAGGLLGGLYTTMFEPRGWLPVLVLSAFASRSYDNGGMPVDLFAGLTRFGEPMSTTSADFDQGIPIAVTLNGQPLDIDDTQVPIVANELARIVAASDRPCTFWIVDLLRIAPGATEPRVEVAITSIDGDVPIDGAMFQDGGTYVLRAFCVASGIPDVAAGDLQTRTFPFAYGFADSAVFVADVQ
jgi:hypothetical protein